jgi:hypothetical protein
MTEHALFARAKPLFTDGRVYPFAAQHVQHKLQHNTQAALSPLAVSVHKSFLYMARLAHQRDGHLVSIRGGFCDTRGYLTHLHQ